MCELSNYEKILVLNILEATSSLIVWRTLFVTINWMFSCLGKRICEFHDQNDFYLSDSLWLDQQLDQFWCFEVAT